MITIAVVTDMGVDTTLTIEEPICLNLCPFPNCGGWLKMIVRSSYFQYRRIDSEGLVDEDYQDCDGVIGETLETFLECDTCARQPKHTTEERVVGSVRMGGQDLEVKEEYIKFVEVASDPSSEPHSGQPV